MSARMSSPGSLSMPRESRSKGSRSTPGLGIPGNETRTNSRGEFRLE